MSYLVRYVYGWWKIGYGISYFTLENILYTDMQWHTIPHKFYGRNVNYAMLLKDFMIYNIKNFG